MKGLHGCVGLSTRCPPQPGQSDPAPLNPVLPNPAPLHQVLPPSSSKDELHIPDTLLSNNRSLVIQQHAPQSPLQRPESHHQSAQTSPPSITEPLIILEQTRFGNICQGPNGEIVLPPGMLESVLSMNSPLYHLQNELRMLKDNMYRTFRSSSRIYDSAVFRQFCIDSGAPNLFDSIRRLMSADRRNDKRKAELDKLTMNIIYTLCYGLSQKCNFLQKDFSAFLLSENLNRPALNTARKLGVTCASETGRVLETSSIAAYELEVEEIIDKAIEEGHFIIVIIDDFTTIHSHRRPGSEQTSNAKCMCTIVTRVFPNIPAIKMDPNVNHLDPDVVSPQALAKELTSKEYMSSLSSTFVSSMSDTMRSQFFHPETVRNRLSTHQYKESENVRKMRQLDNMYLLEFQECKLKNIKDYKTALNLLFRTKVRDYALTFPLFILGDWPTQFYLRQIVYELLGQEELTQPGPPLTLESIHSEACNISTTSVDLNETVIQNPNIERPLLYFPELSLVPMLGALHISLNAQENVMKMFHPMMKFIYEHVFPRSKLAEKPKPWRVTLLLELIYGGWTLIRSTAINVFSNCRDPELGAFMNLLDNYIPLVLSIYSIIFKCNLFEDYFLSVIRVWIMFYCFRRRHYDKAPLIWLSNILYWKKHRPDIFKVIKENITIFDEYAVENAHSIFRAQTKSYFTVSQLIQRAKSTFASKSLQHNFRSAFTPPRYYSFNKNQLHSLKLKVADLLKSMFVSKINDLGSGELKVNKDWWGTEKIPPQCLPVGFHTKCPPKVSKACDLPGCLYTDQDLPCIRFDSCWHAFHSTCLITHDVCPLCQSSLSREISRLAAIAKTSVKSPSTSDYHQDSTTENDEDDDAACPNVHETSEDDLVDKIKEIENEIASLLCPTTLTEEGSLTLEYFSGKIEPAYRRPHCGTCGHERKGHVKVSAAKTFCPRCPEGLCCAGGKQVSCKCDYHSGLTQVQQDVSNDLPLIENSQIIQYDGSYRCLFPSQVSQYSMATLPWCNACTVISLYAGIAFLNGDLELPIGFPDESIAQKYKDCISTGISVYENVIDPPDNQPNLSVLDVVQQIKLPLEDPGKFKGMMVDETGEAFFDSEIAKLCAQPDKKCLLLTLHPDHSMILCIDQHSLGVFDSHGFSNGKGAMILSGPRHKSASFMHCFHHSIMEGYGITVRGGNYTELVLAS